jgi:hypothetical protein
MIKHERAGGAKHASKRRNAAALDDLAVIDVGRCITGTGLLSRALVVAALR